MDYDLRKWEDVIKLAGWIAVGVFVVLVLTMLGDADTTAQKIMVGVQAVAFGVGAGLIVIAIIAFIRLLVFLFVMLLLTCAEIIKGIQNFFVWLIVGILRLPIIIFGLGIAAIKAALSRKAEKPKATEETEEPKFTDDRRTRQEDAKKEEQKQRSRANAYSSSERQALELFEMSRPYTLDQLKKRRMELLKKVHPDQGGSNMMARMVNEAYELLKSKI